ncbi:MAG: hypothetical protein IPM17_09725 [Verrucomicrobia bacterium]|nr:hypothetical protein [Verrucomicrobiota bacterium]
MPERDSPPIELRLRAYAEQRRTQAGGPFSAPPLTRRTVRAEVDRRWGHAARHGAHLRRWNVIWPRLGWALGITAALAIVAMIALDFGQPIKWQTAAKRSQPVPAPARALPEQSTPQQELPPLSSSPTSEAAAVAEAQTPSLRGESFAAAPAGISPAQSAPAAVPPLATFGAPLAEALSDLPPPSLGGIEGSPVTPTLASPSLTARRPPGNATTSAAGPRQPATEPFPAMNQQRFTQNRAQGLRQNVNSPPAPEVLQEFEVQQFGNRLRLVDRDGSTYLAEVSAAPPAAAPALVTASPTATGLRRQAARAPDSLAPEGQGTKTANDTLFFNAVGTNRTLQQRVVFNGRLVFANPQMPPPSLDVVLTNEAAFGIWLDNARIEGEAVIGDRTQIRIEATPTPAP